MTAVTTYLNVPFRDKAEAKALGARWDGEARKWFVPAGRDLGPFSNWLPLDPAKLAEGVFDRNRQLPAPWDYRAVLVIWPPRAAGLGDFARDADRLQRHGVCEAVYAHSRFEGEGAPALIRQTIESALAAWTSAALP